MSTLSELGATLLLAILVGESARHRYAVCGKIVFHARAGCEPAASRCVSSEPTVQRPAQGSPFGTGSVCTHVPISFAVNRCTPTSSIWKRSPPGWPRGGIPGVKAVHVVLEAVTGSDFFPSTPTSS